MAETQETKRQPHPAAEVPAAEDRVRAARAFRLRLVGVIGAALAALVAIFLLSNDPGDAGGEVEGVAGSPALAKAGDPGRAGEFPFDVGDPGPGEMAPSVELPSTDGGEFDLAAERGDTVLLYFQEGLMCQPCWDQISAIEAAPGSLEDLAIDKLVSITTDPADLVAQKVADEGLSTPVLSDESYSVSTAYQTNTDDHVMMQGMGGMHNGHSFVLVGPDGQIQWRADYGGPPEFTMFVPVENLVADIARGLRKADS